MLVTREAVLLFIGVATFLSTITLFIWKLSASVADLKSAQRQTITDVRHDAELNRVKQAALDEAMRAGLKTCEDKIELWHDMLEAASLGCTRQIQHARSKVEEGVVDIRSRFNDVEGYLIKNTEFERRK